MSPTLSVPFLFQQFFIGPTVCQSLCVPGVGNTTVRQDAEHEPAFGAMGGGLAGVIAGVGGVPVNLMVMGLKLEGRALC